MAKIDWAMVTSANLSTQAWGGGTSGSGGEVRICSYEIGVVVWPDLWSEQEDGKEEDKKTRVELVPTFKRDTPSVANDDADAKRTVGWRMPYDLPLVPYAADEKPWCASEPCDEPDWMGRVWAGNGK